MQKQLLIHFLSNISPPPCPEAFMAMLPSPLMSYAAWMSSPLCTLWGSVWKLKGTVWKVNECAFPPELLTHLHQTATAKPTKSFLLLRTQKEPIHTGKARIDSKQVTYLEEVSPYWIEAFLCLYINIYECREEQRTGDREVRMLMH